MSRHVYPDVESLKSKAAESHLTALGIHRQPRHVFADNNIRPVVGLGTTLRFMLYGIHRKISDTYIRVPCCAPLEVYSFWGSDSSSSLTGGDCITPGLACSASDSVSSVTSKELLPRAWKPMELVPDTSSRANTTVQRSGKLSVSL